MFDHSWERSLEYLTNGNYQFMRWAGHTRNSSYTLGIKEFDGESYFKVPLY